jgi:voltage-gated potassium channel
MAEATADTTSETTVPATPAPTNALGDNAARTEDAGRASSYPAPAHPAPSHPAPSHGLGATIADDVLMVLLALVSVFLLCFEVLSEHTPEQLRAFEVADTAICAVFLAEWCWRLAWASDRRTFVKKHWWELLAAIPFTTETTQALRGLNVLRVFRLIRLLRLIRFLVRFKILLNATARFAEHTYLVYLGTLGGIVVMSGALGFHYMEAGHNPNVKSLWDSFWWTIVTITTVGYGDIYPVTTGGRILAIALMMGGVATFSAITATIAAYLVNRKD